MDYKSLWKSKTMWMSIATICTGIGMFVSGEQQLQEVIITIIGAVFGVLRVVTTKPIR